MSANGCNVGGTVVWLLLTEHPAPLNEIACNACISSSGSRNNGAGSRSRPPDPKIICFQITGTVPRSSFPMGPFQQDVGNDANFLIRASQEPLRWSQNPMEGAAKWAGAGPLARRAGKASFLVRFQTVVSTFLGRGLARRPPGLPEPFFPSVR